MPKRTLLLVEPDRLLRWSLVTYLSRWFRVLEAESLPTALSQLKCQTIDAVVLSNELGPADAHAVVRQVLSQDTCARIVRVVTSSYDELPLTTNAAMIEKPFELSQLARLLGVQPKLYEKKPSPVKRGH